MKIKYLLTIPLGYLILSLSRNFSLTVFRYNIPIPLDEIIYVSLDILAVLFLVYLYDKYVLKIHWQDIYVCKPVPQVKWVVAAVLLSTFVLVCCIFLTKGTFIKEEISIQEKIDLAFNTILGGGVRAAITEEVIFRGLIFSSLQKMKGTKFAVAGSSILFAVMHLVNIDTSNVYNVISLLIAIFLIGCAFALIVLETGSIWSGVVFHGLYNVISGDMDILHVSAAESFPAIWLYKPVKEYRWITGIIGSDDIETGLPAMIGFVIVIIVALYLIKKKRQIN